jgi:hypothetical protein
MYPLQLYLHTLRTVERAQLPTSATDMNIDTHGTGSRVPTPVHFHIAAPSV